MGDDGGDDEEEVGGGEEEGGGDGGSDGRAERAWRESDAPPAMADTPHSERDARQRGLRMTTLARASVC